MSELRECPAKNNTKYLAVQWIDKDKMILSGSLYFDTKQECIDWCNSQPKVEQFPDVHYTMPAIHPHRPTESRLRERVRELEGEVGVLRGLVKASYSEGVCDGFEVKADWEGSESFKALTIINGGGEKEDGE